MHPTPMSLTNSYVIMLACIVDLTTADWESSRLTSHIQSASERFKHVRPREGNYTVMVELDFSLLNIVQVVSWLIIIYMID